MYCSTFIGGVICEGLFPEVGDSSAVCISTFLNLSISSSSLHSLFCCERFSIFAMSTSTAFFCAAVVGLVLRSDELLTGISEPIVDDAATGGGMMGEVFSSSCVSPQENTNEESE